MAPSRSYLYVPGDKPDRIPKALASEADAVVIDLEDAVPAGGKAEARAITGRILRERADQDAVWVRITATEPEADIAAVLTPGLTGVWVPKAEPELLSHVDALLTGKELELGREPGSTKIVALVETARGVLRAEQICASPRVVRLGVGEADLMGELRLQPDEHRTELTGIRLALVLASAATGLAAPIGPAELRVNDLTALEATTKTLLRQGFRGRTALHPRQLPTINATFTPSAAEVARARELLDDFQAIGGGVMVDRHGVFADPAVLRGAQEILDRE